MVFDASSFEKIAEAFTQARLCGGSLAAYPGTVPTTLSEAYQIQDAAITQWPYAIGGWKIGGIGGEYAERFGETKLAGPVFENQIYKSSDAGIDMPVFADGFAAIEGEIVFFVKADAPSEKVDWTMEEAQDYVGAVHMGVEIASSPFPKVNDMGPLVTISDFGNNNGLIIGDEIKNWDEAKLENWVVETVIENESMGTATPPGPLVSFRFILENAARRGMPLKKGMAITTGAITGVHQAYSGQSSVVLCSGTDNIKFTLVSA